MANLRERAHEALDKALDQFEGRTLSGGIIDVRLVHTTTDVKEKTTITVFGTELVEMVDGTYEVEEEYTTTEVHSV